MLKTWVIEQICTTNFLVWWVFFPKLSPMFRVAFKTLKKQYKIFIDIEQVF